MFPTQDGALETVYAIQQLLPLARNTLPPLLTTALGLFIWRNARPGVEQLR